MQRGKNWILPKEIMQTGSSESLIGWKSGKTTYVPLMDRMGGTWLWTLEKLFHETSFLYLCTMSPNGPNENQSC